MKHSKSLMQSAKTAALLVSLVGLVPISATLSPAYAGTGYFKCDSGYSLQLRHSNNQVQGARCYKKAAKSYKTPNAGCPIGTTYNRDHQGTTDWCLPIAGSLIKAFRAKCAPGQRKEVRSRADRCYVSIAARTRGVTRAY